MFPTGPIFCIRSPHSAIIVFHLVWLTYTPFPSPLSHRTLLEGCTSSWTSHLVRHYHDIWYLAYESAFWTIFHLNKIFHLPTTVSPTSGLFYWRTRFFYFLSSVCLSNTGQMSMLPHSHFMAGLSLSIWPSLLMRCMQMICPTFRCLLTWFYSPTYTFICWLARQDLGQPTDISLTWPTVARSGLWLYHNFSAIGSLTFSI